MNILQPVNKCLFLITASFVISTVSNAAVFDCSSEPGYCIGEGNTVIFKFQGTSSNVGLFGTLEVMGDSIVASTPDFRAESVDGAGTVSVSDNGTVQLIARPGYQIGSINILETGDYLMSGNTGSVDVDVDGWSDVWDWNKPVFGTSAHQTLSINTGLPVNDGASHAWQGSNNFDLTGASWDGINHVGVTVQNNLYATSSVTGDTAWINKQINGGVNLTVITTAVPVPAAGWLFISALTGLFGFAKRKKLDAN